MNIYTRRRSDCYLYTRWHNVRNSCLNPRCSNYHLYGGRGIQIYKEWAENKIGFDNFFDYIDSELGHAPDLSYKLSRIDQFGDFEPDNLVWTTVKEISNRRPSCHFVEYQGQRHNIQTWSQITGINYETLLQRFLKNWPAEQALTRDT